MWSCNCVSGSNQSKSHWATKKRMTQQWIFSRAPSHKNTPVPSQSQRNYSGPISFSSCVSVAAHLLHQSTVYTHQALVRWLRPTIIQSRRRKKSSDFSCVSWSHDTQWSWFQSCGNPTGIPWSALQDCQNMPLQWSLGKVRGRTLKLISFDPKGICVYRGTSLTLKTREVIHINSPR